MGMQRVTLSVESLGERVVPDATPLAAALPNVVDVAASQAATPVSIPDRPDPVLPRDIGVQPPPANPMRVAEKVLARLEADAREKAYAYVRSKERMDAAMAGGNDAAIAIAIKEAVATLNAYEEAKALYKSERDAYLALAKKVGEAPDEHIVDLDLDELEIVFPGPDPRILPNGEVYA